MLTSEDKRRARFTQRCLVGNEDQCWLWRGHIDRCGYGKLGIEPAHRVSCKLFRGEIPPGMYVLHKCDNPPCVNPAHLFVGTQLENMRDAMRKGRFRADKRGEDHGNAKLTEDAVLVILNTDTSRRGVRRELAQRFGVCAGTIDAIKYGRTWKHVRV